MLFLHASWYGANCTGKSADIAISRLWRTRDYRHVGFPTEEDMPWLLTLRRT
jgi:hypothetical protein